MTKKGRKEYKTYLNRQVRRTVPDTIAYLSDGDADVLMPVEAHPSKGYRRVTVADYDLVGGGHRSGS